MKKACAILMACVLLFAVCGCGNGKEASALRFSDAVGLETIRALDGKTVSIIGYMATLSPISGEYIYLMNMPYQSCPFCVPNTSQLSNTMAVYAKSGKTFAFTDQAVRVTGTMKVDDYTDDYGYTYNYRIVDASCEEIDLSEVSENYALWQTIASDGIVAEVNSMMDYLHFLCQWTEYISGYTYDDGKTEEYYLYPGDVENYLEDDGVYGYADKSAETYFPSLAARAEAIDAEQLSDLVAIIRDSEQLAAEARGELEQGNYSYLEDEDKYLLNRSDELYARWYDLYARFSGWLSAWQL